MSDEADRLEDLKDDEQAWSVSRLKAMGSCGRLYRLRYLDDGISVPTPSLALGTALHRTIERIHKEKLFSMPQYLEAWDEEWHEAGAEVQNWRDERTFDMEKVAMKILQDYVVKNQDAEILYSEISFPQDTALYRVGDHPVKGIIDQVRRVDGRLVVIDFKSSKRKPHPLVLRSDPQFTIYHKVASEMLQEPFDIGWYHLRTGDLILTERTEEDYQMVVEMMTEMKQKVEHKMFARNLGYHCTWCDYKESCLGKLIQSEV